MCLSIGKSYARAMCGPAQWLPIIGDRQPRLHGLACFRVLELVERRVRRSTTWLESFFTSRNRPCPKVPSPHELADDRFDIRDQAQRQVLGERVMGLGCGANNARFSPSPRHPPPNNRNEIQTNRKRILRLFEGDGTSSSFDTEVVRRRIDT